jgi:hypothetical protein
VLAGLEPGESVVLVDGMDNDYQTFAGYTGEIIGRSAMSSELSGMIGVSDNDNGAREVILGGLGPNEFTDTRAWTNDGCTILANAVNWVTGR